MAGTVCFLGTQLTAAWPSPARIVVGVAAGLAVYGVAALVPAIRDDLAGVRAWGRSMLSRDG